jgi:hypothetical protein
MEFARPGSFASPVRRMTVYATARIHGRTRRQPNNNGGRRHFCHLGLGDVIDEVDLLTCPGTALPWSITRLEPGAGAAIPFAVPPAADPPPH